METLAQSSLILAVIAFSIAITSLSRNLRNKLVIAFALLCGVVCCWALSFFLERLFATGIFYRFHVSFNLLLAPVGLIFVRVLTRVEDAFLDWLYRLSIVYCVSVLALEWSSFSALPSVQSAAYLAPSFLVLACFRFMFIDWRLQKGAVRKDKTPTIGLTRRTWVYIGALIVLGMAVMDHAPWLGVAIPSVGNILLCLYLFVVSEAIIHQRLLDLSALFNRLIVLVFVSCIFTVIFTILVGWVENAPSLFLLNAFLASFIIILLSEPFKKLISMGVSRFLSTKYLRFVKKTEDAQAQLVGVLDTSGLSQLTITFLESVLPLESASIFILRSDGTKYRRIRGHKDDALVNREILVKHPIIEYFVRMRRRGEVPILLDTYLENEIDRSTSTLQRQSLDSISKGMSGLQANIVIPFIDGATVLGFAAIRAQTPPEPWGNNWGVLSVIAPFFQQAARVLKNMDVYVRLREKDRLAALGEMAAGLAHEIRNPLGAIKGAAQYLEPQKATSDQAPFLNVIVEEVDRLNKVVSQFLDYSRPWNVEMIDCDIGFLIQKTAVLFQSDTNVSMQGIRLIIEEPEAGFASVPKFKGAPEQIKQVLVNLIQNSIHALSEVKVAREGIIKIGAYTERRIRDRALEIVVFVEDNGTGIRREDLDRIFIPFFTTSPSGTGLGLSISLKIIEAHGGRIEANSEEGRFTRFAIHLPIA